MGKHVAIKCTYNNGGEGANVGFHGTCSENIIKSNIESGRVWCNQKECECKEFYDNGFKGNRPIDPCYESVLFRDWRCGAGIYQTGKRAGTPIRLSNVEKGKIAILTTRFPGDSEIDRKIIGFFKIGDVINEPGKETILVADKDFRIRLPLEEAKELFFWDYYATKGGAFWGSGLVRYLDDNKVARILLDLKETLRDEKSKAIVSNLLGQDFQGILPSPASGPRAKRSGSRAKRIALIRKYGYGGEGADHRKLKEWIAKNPCEIGITDLQKAEVEYEFPSGDTADILFRLSGNRDAVVEIKTSDPFPGCYQALKYRILRCAELGLNLNSPNVRAILVAWEIPKEIKKFCEKYGIQYVEKKIKKA